VLCDRFTDSTKLIRARPQLGSKAVLRLHEILCANLNTDLTIPAR